MNNVNVKIEKFSDFGPNEPFVARVVIGLGEVVDATSYKNKEEIKMVINGIFIDGLSIAFRSLQELRKMENGEKEKMLLDVKKEYFNFYNRIWAAYKDQMPRAAKVMGFDIGFIFQKEKEFKSGALEFQQKHPEINKNFVNFILKNKTSWQNAVVKFRNDYAEHQSLFENDVKGMLTLKSAEICFENCWFAIEEILMELICTRLYDFVSVIEIPEEKRDPKMPKRFKIVYGVI